MHELATRHHVHVNCHNVRSILVLEGIRDSARITNGSSTVTTQSMVELPIHAGSSKDSIMKADRTGSLDMHLGAISKCLPIFAAAGHFYYNIEISPPLPGRYDSAVVSQFRRCSMLYNKLSDTGCDLGLTW